MISVASSFFTFVINQEIKKDKKFCHVKIKQ